MIGRPVAELEAATNSRVAFIIRFGTGVLPDRKTVFQADDQVYIAAVSGTVAEAVALAGNPRLRTTETAVRMFTIDHPNGSNR